MYNPLIKICGIQTPELAQQTIQAGAHLIGILFHPQSKRSVDLKTGKAIAIATQDANGIPIAIFVDQSAIQMQTICEALKIQMIQVHGPIAKREHHHLPSHYQRVYVQSVLNDGTILRDEENGLKNCDQTRDYVLFDNATSGKGLAFNWNRFNYRGSFRMGLAGGLTAHNIGFAINQFKPALIDTSSGVENANGEKQIQLIKHFIDQIHLSTRELNYELT